MGPVLRKIQENVNSISYPKESPSAHLPMSAATEIGGKLFVVRSWLATCATSKLAKEGSNLMNYMRASTFTN